MRQVIFKKIEMHNFKCFEHIDFEFTPNRFVIVQGNNGQGKTTLCCDGIVYALYGKTTKNIKADDVIRIRSGKNTYVKLTFSIDDDEYRVERYRKHKVYKNEFLIYKDNGKTPVDVSIEDILMPFNIFINCLMFSQFIKKSFTEETDGNQKKIFDMMLNLDAYEEYRQSIKNKEDELSKNKIPTISSEIEFNEKYLNTRNAELENIRKSEQSEKDNHDKSVEDINKEIKQLLDKKSKFEAELKTHDIKDIKRQLTQYEIDHTTLKNKIESKQREYNQDINLIRQKIESDKNNELNRQLRDITDKINQLNNKLSNLDISFNNNRSGIENENQKAKSKYLFDKSNIDEEFNRQVEPVRERLQTYSMELSNLSDKKVEIMESMKTVNDRLKTMTDGLNKDDPTCYACGQNLSDEYSKSQILSEVNNMKTELKRLKQNLDNIESSSENYGKEIDKESQNMDNINKSKSEKMELLEDWKVNVKHSLIYRLDNITTEYQRDREALNNKLSDLNNDKTKIELTLENKYKNKLNDLIDRETKRHNDEINDINDRIEVVGSIILELTTTLDLLNQLANNFNECVKEIEMYEARLRIMNENRKLNKEKYDESVKNIQSSILNISTKIDINNQELNKIKTDIEILKFWKNAFSSTGIKAVLLDESIPIINSRASELSEMTDNLRVRFSSQSQLKSGEMRNKFSVNCIHTEHLTDSRDCFSGGEGRLIDIITLLSLRHLLEHMTNTHFNIIIMDEILDALDPKNVDIVINMLNTLSNDYIVLLISHTLRDTVEANEILTV